ncbi:MAG: enoyl-CoA hydratase/isomerase family protein, partial [Coxiellaceae bacterium]|nr:enoyl-CoA hydratase/isomerase family protein [Coxiellaceae bacterium]
CAGGDIKKLYENRTTQPKLLAEFFYQEYRLDLFIHDFTKPYFAFMHGITMGGGAGLSINGRYRIAAENLVFAMPETKIGFYPDVGASYFLNQCPGYSGLYLALSGNSINCSDAYALGLITHPIAFNNFKKAENAILNAESFSDTLLKPFINDLGHSTLSEHLDTIDACFSKDSVTAIIDTLTQYDDWTKNVAEQLKQRSPTSLQVTFEAYHRAKTMTFNDIMQMEFDISQQFLHGGDFFEGIRAAVVDKDQRPQWQPLSTTEKISQYFQSKGTKLN